MDEFAAVKEFNINIEQFLDFLKILSPSNYHHRIFEIETFKNANKFGPIQYYAIYVLPYKNHIANGDIHYFLNKDIITQNKTREGSDFRMLEEIIKNIWVNLDKDDKAQCVQYLQLLTSNADDYVRALVDGKKDVSYDLIDTLIGMNKIDIGELYYLISLIVYGKFDEINKCTSDMISKLVN